VLAISDLKDGDLNMLKEVKSLHKEESKEDQCEFVLKCPKLVTTSEWTEMTAFQHIDLSRGLTGQPNDALDLKFCLHMFRNMD